MEGTALITGASSGIGAEFARLHASNGGDLVLVARRVERLIALKDELEAEHHVSVRVVVADLAAPGAVESVLAAISDLTIDILINNAGLGGFGPFHEQEFSKHHNMISLNMTATTELAHRLLPGMVRRESGRILNVSSTASFLPGPGMAVYFASKAFVTSLGLALAEELRGTGVSVTTLCPGPVKTEFGTVAGLQHAEVMAWATTPERTARSGYRAMVRGDLVAFDDWKLRIILEWVMPLFPRWLKLRLARRAME